jgi:hypothetical protein
MKRIIALIMVASFAGVCVAGSCCGGKKDGCHGDNGSSTTQTVKTAPAK